MGWHQKRGLTAIEILVTVAIMALLFIGLSAPLVSFYEKTVFQGATENIMAMFDEARKSTLSSLDSSRYGVYVTPTSTTLFAGDTYTAGDPDNDVYELNGMIEISSINFNAGSSEVVFDRITGETDDFGTLEVSLLRGSTSPKTITIYSSGLVEINE